MLASLRVTRAAATRPAARHSRVPGCGGRGAAAASGGRRRRVTACCCAGGGSAGGGDDSAQPQPPQQPPGFAASLPWEEAPQPPPAEYASLSTGRIGRMDCNQLQTALGVAIAAEDYVLATRIKERLQAKLLETGSAVISRPLDWRALGVPEWLADRAERLGFMFPTEVQRRATPVLLSGADAVLVSETGSGKTAAALVPALAGLDYPPDLFPDDLEGPQLLLLVPSFELGVQACLLLYKLWGGNISSRQPGDPGNMFTYQGPAGIKVRGLLNDEELQMALSGGRYLRGVHALVATPDMALALASLPNSPLSFQDLRAIVVDELDAQLHAFPASFGQLLDLAVQRYTPPGRQAQGLTAVGLDGLDQQQPGAGSGGDGSPGAGPAAGQQGVGDGGPGGLDNLAKLKALLDQQQQQAQRAAASQGSPVPGSPAGVDGGSASLAAAAARLEGLMAAPAATPAAPDAGSSSSASSSQQPLEQQQQQQPSSDADSGSGGSSSSSSSSSEQPPLAASSPAAAAAVPPDDDTPMPKPQVVLVGATVSGADVQQALQRGWVVDPVEVQVGAVSCVPAGLRHRAIVVGQPQQRLGGLVASLRRDLTSALAAADAAAASPPPAGEPGKPWQQPVRVIVFARSEEEARGAAEPLRSALWGEHTLSVLLPSTGAEPIKALTAFRDRVASLLLATPSAARGLDLPAISHVYSLGLPQDATEYVHRAGRAGRIGSTAGGEVVSIVTREELPALCAMLQDELGLHVQVQELDQAAGGAPGGLGLLGQEFAAARERLLLRGDDDEAPADELESLETARKGLEDLFNLYE